MNNKFGIIIISILLLNSFLYSQNIVSIKGDGGYFISNTDNSLPETDSKNIKYGWGIKFGYEHQLDKNYSLLTEIGYFSAKVNDASKYILYGEQFGAFPYSVDLLQYSFPLDVSLLRELNNYIKIGIGLSFEGINHDIRINLPNNRGSYEDKMNMFAIGSNILLQFQFPIPNFKRISFIGDLKLRYLKSIWEGKKGRDLDNYNYSFLQSVIDIGISYNI